MIRKLVLSLAAAGAALAGLASPAFAQASASPHSTIRIAIGKDRAPAAPRVDTVATARVDTVRMPGRVDTVTKTVTQTVTRVDSVMMPIEIPHVGSLYAGLAVGPSFAAPQFTNSANPGWRVEVPLGIDPVQSPVGLRVNLAYSRYTPQSWLGSTYSSDAQMMSGDADLKLRLLSVTPLDTRVQLYGLGGVSYARFMNVLESGPNGWQVGSNVGGSNIPAADNVWHNGLGWNAGAGASFGKGNKSLFTEIRFTYINGVAAPIASIPLVVGVTIY